MEIYNVGNRVMNTYVYQAPAGYVMVDTGYEHSLKAVKKRLDRLSNTIIIQRLFSLGKLIQPEANT